jgi:tetratricopeptide (TPR) repeat protein
MPSHARKQFLQVSATHLGLQQQAGGQVLRSDITQYELMLSKLHEDRRRLKDVQSIERRADIKRVLLPEYMPWVNGVLEGGSGVQDDVLMTVLIWCIDTTQFGDALRLAEYAIKHKLATPDQFNRDLPTVLAEEIAEQSIKAINAGDCSDEMLFDLMQTNLLTSDCDMPDEVRAKLMKAIGYAHRAQGSYHEAQAALRRALDLSEKIGVKKDIEGLERAIKNSATAETGAG